MPGSVFEKIWGTPDQYRAVAIRRLGDAWCLFNNGNNERLNAAVYLGGICVEVLLKAKCLEEYPWLQKQKASSGLTGSESKLWKLCYEKHDLETLLNSLPGTLAYLSKLEERDGISRLKSLREITITWTIFVRYSPRMVQREETKNFLDKVEKVLKWLK